jgi:hypothetical protein
MLHLDGRHYIDPAPDFIADHASAGFYISDTYRVRLTPQPDRVWPTAHEIGRRIETVAKKKGLRYEDLHMNIRDHELCLASTMELDETFEHGFALQIYIEEFLVPFLFLQTHFAQTGRWLWGQLDHGVAGLLQWLGRQDNYTAEEVIATFAAIQKLSPSTATSILGKRTRSSHLCLCDSGRKIKECCEEIKVAISRIRAANARNALGDI